MENISQAQQNNLSVDTINKWAHTIKYAWTLLVGCFLLGVAVNFQMLTQKYENEKRDAAISDIQGMCKKFWTTPMLADLTVYSIRTNHYNKMTESEIRRFVEEIHQRYRH
jgi:hypothetical protein